METRHWDEARRVTISLRTKESEEDYRYFPEPNLPPITLTEEYINNVRILMPELPDNRKRRLIRQYGLPTYNATVITSSKYFADFFEETLKFHRDPKKVSNWMMTDLLKTLHDQNVELEDSKITPRKLAEMIHLIDDGVISGKIAKKLLPQIVETGKSPREIVKRYDLTRITSREQIKDLVEEVFLKNKKAVHDALRDDNAVNYLVGQLMRLSSGRVDPLIANQVIRERLKEVKQ
jgi:aspartyl-tRNA(Asn)/glutamyl-tRNA(Gln) amidotransferase subunit B